MDNLVLFMPSVGLLQAFLYIGYRWLWISYISFIVCSPHSLRLYQEDFLAFLNGPFCIYLGDHVVCMVYCLCATILAF